MIENKKKEYNATEYLEKNKFQTGKLQFDIVMYNTAAYSLELQKIEFKKKIQEMIDSIDFQGVTEYELCELTGKKNGLEELLKQLK